MKYDEYIQQIDAAFVAAQRREDVAETQILAKILYHLVHPRGNAVLLLTNLVAKTADPAIRARYEQAIADIQACEAPPPDGRQGRRSPERAMMPDDGPISAEQLAELAHKLYQEEAAKRNLPLLAPWEDIPLAQHSCLNAVARRLLHRVDARVSYLFAGMRSGPFVSVEVCDTEESEASL